MIVKYNLRLTNPSQENKQVRKGLEPEKKEIMSQQKCLKMIKNHKEKYNKEEK